MKVYPVIHLNRDEDILAENLRIIFEGKTPADGVFLISMHGHDDFCLEIAEEVKQKYPNKLVGVNLLTVHPLRAVQDAIEAGLDMTWSDNPGITSKEISEDAEKVSKFLDGKNHVFFASVAFKYQKPEPDPVGAAINSMLEGFVTTTSGTETGVAADLDKVRLMKEAVGVNRSLALASGLTPENVSMYVPYVDYALVCTGISQDFYRFSEHRFQKFMEQSKLQA